MNIKFSIVKLPAIFFVMIARHLPVSHEIDKMRHWTQIHRSAIKKDLWFIALLIIQPLNSMHCKVQNIFRRKIIDFCSTQWDAFGLCFSLQKILSPLATLQKPQFIIHKDLQTLRLCRKLYAVFYCSCHFLSDGKLQEKWARVFWQPPVWPKTHRRCL